MEQDIFIKLEEQERKLDDIYRSVEKTRKYFLWTLIITLVCFALPLIGLAIMVPQLINSYSAVLNF